MIRTAARALLFFSLFLIVPCVQAGDKEAGSSAKIAEAIRNLGNASYQVREEAGKYLWGCGDEAYAAVKQAAQSDDPEVLMRARAILEKFDAGIFPDTPPEVVALINEYRATADQQAKEQTLKQLANAGLIGFKCAARTLRAETNTRVLKSGYRMLNEYARRLVVGAPDDSTCSDVLRVLRENVRYSDQSAARLYVIMAIETDSLDREIKENEKSYTTDPVAARLLACLYMCKGDSQKAAMAGKLSNDDSIYTFFLQEACDWKKLFELSSKDPESDDVAKLALRATYARLAGERKGYAEAIEKLIKVGGDDTDSGWRPVLVARALLLNGEVDKAADFLIGVKKYGLAAQILDAHVDYAKLRTIATNLSDEALNVDGGSRVDRKLDAIALSVTEPEYGPWSDRQVVGAWRFTSTDIPVNIDDALALCRKGRELTVKGDENGGAKLLRQASLLVLDDEAKRFALAVELRRGGYTKESKQQFELMMGMACFTSPHVQCEVLETYAVPAAVAKKDYRAAARYRRRDILNILQANVARADIVQPYMFIADDMLMLEAMALAGEKKIDEAVRKVDVATSMLPFAVSSHIEFVKFLDGIGAKAQADTCFDHEVDRLKAAERNNVHLLTYDNEIAWFSACCGRRLSEALPYGERAVTLRPRDWHYMDTLAEVYFKSGNREKAIEWIKKALQLEPNEPYLKSQLRRFEKEIRALSPTNMGVAGDEIPFGDWRQSLRIPGGKVIFMRRTVHAMIVALVLMAGIRSEAPAQTFAPQTNIVLTGVFNCAVVWGDYDNDGKLDILLTGETEEPVNNQGIRGDGGMVRFPVEHAGISKIYRNMGNGSFVEQPGIVLTPIKECSAAWGDYDNDGYLDILAVGGTSKIYHNNGGSSFTELAGVGLVNGVDHTSAVWGDLDNDGYLDILLTGVQEQQGFNIVAKMYRNDGKGMFGLLDKVRLEPVQRSSVALCDYDRDGYLDIMLTGGRPNGAVSILYRNEGNSFLPAQTGIVFAPVLRCAVAWGDYDNDGYPDLLLAGQCPSMNGWQPVTKLYHNNGDNTFTEQTNVVLAQVMRPGIAWGDYDNDGNIDILLSGMTGNHTVVTKVYRNDGHGNFEEQTSITLEHVFRSSAAWGDYDNDGKLDILLAGATEMGQQGDFGAKPVTIVYHNELAVSNKPPTAPTGLTAVYTGGVVQFSWVAAQDAETPSKALTYNLRIGSRPGAADHFSTMANAANGFRRIPQFGPIQGTNWTWVPRGISSGSTIYWSVQAIDGGLAGSHFAPEQTVAIGAICRNPVNITATEGTCADAIKLSWDSTDAPSYEIWRSTKSDRNTAKHVSEGHDPAGAEYDDSAAGRGIEYYYWVRAVYTNTLGHLVGPAKGWWPPFDEQTNNVFPHASRAAWGDYDNDGKLDILLMDNYSSLSRLYRNMGDNTFEEQTNVVLPGAVAAVWVDLDNDGWLDILALSHDELIICHNDAGKSFEQLRVADLKGMWYAGIACGDYNNDGRADILITGPITKLYRNEGNNVFSEQSSIHLAQLSSMFVDWGDFDNDGDLDILMAGGITYRNEQNLAASKVYRNNGDNTFREASWIDLPGLVHPHLGWGDYDNDGNLDILLTGCRGENTGQEPAFVYRNNGDSTFVEQWRSTGNDTVSVALAWCDCDSDGDLDIVAVSTLYRNDGSNNFTKMEHVLPDGYCVWGDYDNDGKLDCMQVEVDGRPSKLYRNCFGGSNQPPTAPAAPAVVVSSNVVRFTWNPSTDDNTPSAGLNYNVRVGSAPGGCDIVSPMADPKTGFRRIPARGPIQGTNWFIRGLTNGTYYFAVQAIDTSLAGSPFSGEIKFSITNAPAGK